MKQTKKQAACVAVFGTGSDVGKSIVATALCRYFRERGLRVAPFKAQNMSNNSGVTPEGLEMGRAQIVQAEAAGAAPRVDMNPVLLKPTSEVGSQVVVLGKVSGNSTAAAYHAKKDVLFETALAALSRLRAEHDVVVIEGAGSCAEVNLMAGDIVNFNIARAADAPVILVADIHRGGVFAQIVGTLYCLPYEDQERVKGFVINRFRGDIDLFRDGTAWIENATGKPVFGVLPWVENLGIEAEDSVVIEKGAAPLSPAPGGPGIAVIRLPHISNFTDFDPLTALKGLSLSFVHDPADLSGFAGVVLPGSKNTRHDLAWLNDSGWAGRIRDYADRGGAVLGICGGYQMLGEGLDDPAGHEGPPGRIRGLGLLPVSTTMMAEKTTTLSRFTWDGCEGLGYEIHMGKTVRHGGRPLFSVVERNGAPCADEDGCVSGGGNVMGTYMHGLFDRAGITRRMLAAMGLSGIDVPDVCGLPARERAYTALLEHVVRHVDVDAIFKETFL
ncbi:cobyric acid synthase [Desulfatiferula olefinivorans]